MRKLLLSLFSVSLIVTTSSSAISCGVTTNDEGIPRDILTDLGMMNTNEKYVLEFNKTPTKDDVYNYILSICNNKSMLTLNQVVGKITIQSYEFTNSNLKVTLVSYDNNLNIDGQSDFEFPLQIQINEEIKNEFTQWITDNNKLSIETINSWYQEDDDSALTVNMNNFFNTEIINFIEKNDSEFSNFIKAFKLNIKFEPKTYYFYDESGILVNSFSQNFEKSKEIKIVSFKCTEIELSMDTNNSSYVDFPITVGSKPEKVNLGVVKLKDSTVSEAVEIKKSILLDDDISGKNVIINHEFNTAMFNFYNRYLLNADSNAFETANTKDWWTDLNSTISLKYEYETIPLEWDQSNNNCFDNFIDFVNQHKDPTEDVFNIENVKLIIVVGDNDWFTGTLEFNCNLNIGN